MRSALNEIERQGHEADAVIDAGLSFMPLYRHRGDVVYNDRIDAEMSEGRDRPSAEPIREHMRQLRKVLAGSRTKSSIIEASAMR